MDEIKDYKNMVIDAHTHIGGVAYTNMLLGGYPYSQSITELMSEMDKNGVTHAITTPFPIFYGRRDKVLVDEALSDVLLKYEKAPYYFANKMMLDEVDAFGKNRFFPFALMSLNRDLEKQLDYINLLAENHKIYGIKLYTVYDGIYLSEMIGNHSFVDFLIKNKYPIMIHSSFEGKGDADDIIKFAKAYPEININIAHMARFKKSALAEINTLDNVYMDLSPLPVLCEFMKEIKKDDLKNIYCNLDYSSRQEVVSFIFKEFPTKAMFGSDAPFYNAFEYSKPENYLYSYKDSIDLVKNHLPYLTKNTINFLFGDKKTPIL